MDARQIMMGAFGITILFILLTNLIVPNWNTVGGANVSGTGLSQSAWQGLILVIGIAFIFGIAYSLISKMKK